MKHSIFFTRQEGFDVTQGAVCTFEARDPNENENSFMILSEAVTKWVKDTEAGSFLHESTSEDTNIGDLDLNKNELEPYGIRNFERCIFSGDEFADYDSHLVQLD